MIAVVKLDTGSSAAASIVSAQQGDGMAAARPTADAVSKAASAGCL